MRVIPTSYQAPNVNAYAQRWVQTVREECLDHIFILNETHLQRVLKEYVDDYYNGARPQQGIGQQFPIPHRQPQNSGTVQSRKVLGGIISDYYRAPSTSLRYLN